MSSKGTTGNSGNDPDVDEEIRREFAAYTSEVARVFAAEIARRVDERTELLVQELRKELHKNARLVDQSSKAADEAQRKSADAASESKRLIEDVAKQATVLVRQAADLNKVQLREISAQETLGRVVTGALTPIHEKLQQVENLLGESIEHIHGAKDAVTQHVSKTTTEAGAGLVSKLTPTLQNVEKLVAEQPACVSASEKNLKEHVSDTTTKTEGTLSNKASETHAELKRLLESQLATTRKQFLWTWLAIAIGQIVVVTSIAAIYLMLAARR